jgi:hypothetical protein
MKKKQYWATRLDWAVVVAFLIVIVIAKVAIWLYYDVF